MLSRNALSEFELCIIGNLCPNVVEEAKAMVPSLKHKGHRLDDEKIDKMHSDLTMIRKFAYPSSVSLFLIAFISCSQTGQSLYCQVISV